MPYIIRVVHEGKTCFDLQKSEDRGLKLSEENKITCTPPSKGVTNLQQPKTPPINSDLEPYHCTATWQLVVVWVGVRVRGRGRVDFSVERGDTFPYANHMTSAEESSVQVGELPRKLFTSAGRASTAVCGSCLRHFHGRRTEKLPPMGQLHGSHCGS